MSRDSNADPNINLENGGIAPADTEAILGQLDDIHASVVRDLEGAFDALGSIEATMPRVRDQRVHSRFFAVRAHALNYATRYTEAEAAGRTAVRHAEAVSDEVEAARAWMTLVHAWGALGIRRDATSRPLKLCILGAREEASDVPMAAWAFSGPSVGPSESFRSSFVA